MKKISMTALILLLLVAVYVAGAFIPAFFVKKGLAAGDRPGKMIVGHRGAAGLAPENTLSAIEAGINAGAHMVEIDIHLTSDGQLLVCHDQKVDRTTTGHGRIDGMTLAQAQALRVVDDRGNVTAEHLPSLDEVLSAVAGRCRLLIEIKRTGKIYQGIEQKLVDALNAHHAWEWVIVQSFNDSVLLNMHRIAPHARLEKLVVAKLPGLPFIINDSGLDRWDYEKYAFVSAFNFYNHGLNQSLIDELHAHGKQVKVWTLDTPDSQPCWTTVDGYITNRPDAWR